MPRRLLLPFLLALLPAAARADQVDNLAQALLTDGSYKVRVQAALLLGKLKDPRGKGALVEALHDNSDAVRGVAAGALGKLGDPSVIDPLRRAASDASPFTRNQAKQALALLESHERDPAGSHGRPTNGNGTGGGSRRFYLSVIPFAGQGGAEVTRLMHDSVANELGRLPGVTLDGPDGVRERFLVDGNITNLSSTRTGPGAVRTDCDVRVLLETYPDRAVKMIATVGGSLEGSTDPKDVASAKSDCLADAAKQISEKVQTYLKGR